MTHPQQLYAVPEVAGMIGITAKTLYRLTAEGRISTVRIGRKVMIPQHEIDRIIKEGVR